MTCHTNEYSDPNKISISLGDDKGYHYKRFFEQGLNALLADPHFLLLYVPENGVKMQIIRPSSNPHHLERIMKMMNEETRDIPSFYYALSHLWGISESNRHLWIDIGNYVDDENGQPVDPVSMRPEKRDPLLALLKDHPGSYWWIDVLCARTDTPLDIMGDIYSCCYECIVMIDCEPDLIPQLYAMMDADEAFPNYCWVLENRNLDDLLPYKQLYDDKYPQMIDLLYALMQSQWWQRVWTWQEMALPVGGVRLMAETGTHRSLNNTITVDDLGRFYNAVFVINEYEYNRQLQESKESTEWLNVRTVLHWLFDIFRARRSNNQRIKNKKNARIFYFLICSLGKSTRRCMDPVDYVYGVLGMFHFKIPRMTDPNTVWQLFLAELDNYMMDFKDKKFSWGRITGISDNAYQIDVLKAKNMADLYNDLLVVVEDGDQ
ncbi:hypothetical protein O0I10_009746 [Lichtheimia ornata]|uniref:Heterokaryon incompatibility domain-containing protein n=1 Tax=Lichtheimia ornata TaxID=688661 RepID=A0AAD7UVS8_9FUNG|nr:uncharacterized protein O0I10_009746 [Lichtheimia ornata]KAJ8654564.1 hypothetical protein O0I10_009746 [Lichtheimia ornata]